MKKSWKKLLCSLMLAPCMFFATACGDDPEDPSNLTVDLTAEQQQEAFATLRTVAAAAFNNDGSKDQAYTMQYAREDRQVFDISNAGLTGENRAVIENSVRLNYADNVTRTVYGGYKANNTGYRSETFKIFNSEGTSSSTELSAEIVKYNGQYYELYQNNNNDKLLYRVDNNYAKNTFAVDADKLFNIVDYQDLYFLFEYMQDNTDFVDFRNVLVDLSAESIADTKIQNSGSVDFSNYITTQYAFSVTNDVYTLKVDLVMDATNAPVVYLEDGVLTGNGSISISFDANSIKNLSFNYVSQMTLQESSASVFVGYVDQEFDSNDVVVETDTDSISVSIDFASAFDDNYYNQSLTDYVGTGNNGEVENVGVQATLCLTNWNLDESLIAAQFTYNDNLFVAIQNELSYILSRNNLFIQSCYFVVDGELIEITQSTLVPSSEFTVVVSLTDRIREFVETNVTIYTVNDGSENLCVFYTDDNLYNEIKAVFGLTNEQIAGIYGDAELQNLLDSSTLITENMTVYLVLAD